MSNNFQGIQSGLAELKNFYQGPIKDQFNEDVPWLQYAEKVEKGWSGYQVVRPLRVRRNQGIGATSDGGTLPAIGRQTTVQATFQAAFNYLRFGVTGPMIKASATDIGSFVRTASYELEMGYKDLKWDVCRQLGWDGSGTLAQANANTAASTTLVIKGRESVEAALNFVDVGLVFDIVSAGVVIASGITVNAISGTPTSSTATLTLNAPVTCSAGDTLVRNNSYGYEITGFLYSEDGGTTSIYGVNRATYPSYQGNVLNLSFASQLTLDRMQQIYNQAVKRGKGKIVQIICDHDSLRMYQKLLIPDKRYVNTMGPVDGSFGDKGKFNMEFNGAPVIPDQTSPQRFSFIGEDALKNYTLADMEFADETGSMYIAQTSADQFETRIRYFTQLFNEQPSACASLQGYLSP